MYEKNSNMNGYTKLFIPAFHCNTFKTQSYMQYDSWKKKSINWTL